jgi:hypothetical protein
MNKNRGFIAYLLVIVIAAAAILFFYYVWKTNASKGLSTSSAGSAISNTPVGNSLLNFGSTNFGQAFSSSQSNVVKNSPYAGSVTLSSGNAESSYQPDDEYIQIYNGSQSSVDISGWTLENAYGNRPIQTTGNQAVNVVPQKVTIPLGTNFLDPSGVFTLSPVILEPGDTAIVTTGGPFVSYPFKISVSFRENICTGYLNYTYPFDPSMPNNCPAPKNEVGINSITDVCYNYVEDLPTCYDPAVQDKNNLKNNFQQNCIDYIDNHFNYPACVANHEGDSNFNLPTWRVFLGLNQELWHEPHDSIKLFDQNGKLVDEIDY